MLKSDAILCVHIPSIPTMRWEVEMWESREAGRPPSRAYITVNKRSYPKQGEWWASTIQTVFHPTHVQLYLNIWTQGYAFHTIIPKDKKRVPYEQYPSAVSWPRLWGHISSDLMLRILCSHLVSGIADCQPPDLKWIIHTDKFLYIWNYIKIIHKDRSKTQ